jgi:hypothetical protein
VTIDGGDVVPAGTWGRPPRGRGRPPVGERIEVRLPADTIARLDRIAAFDGVTRAELLRGALIHYAVKWDARHDPETR